jgi:hypothetical protein
MAHLKRYKTGFERLGIVAFVIVACAIALLHLIAETGYKPPRPGTEDHRQREQALNAQCDASQADPLNYLCREASKAKLRWHHYTMETDTQTYVIAALILLGLAILLSGRWAVRWVLEGFRKDIQHDEI